MNNQDAFNQYCRHMATLTERTGVLTTLGNLGEVDDLLPDTATDAVFMCSYWTDDGRTCGVGALLADDDERQRVENGWQNKPIVEVLSDDPQVANWFSDVANSMLGELQMIHDREANWGPSSFTAWGSVKYVGDSYSLDTSVLQELGVLS